MKPLPSTNDRVAEAFALLRAGRLDVAEPLLRSVLAVEPKHFDALQALGAVLVVTRRYAEAERVLTKAVARQPRSDSALYNLAVAQAKLGRRENAVATLGRVVKLAPGLAVAHELLGEQLNRLGRPEHALPSYARACALAPDNAMTLSSLIEVKRKLCDWHDIVALEARLVELAATAHRVVEPMLLCLVSDDPNLHRANSILYANEFLPPTYPDALKARRFTHAPRRRDRIRIAYLSADLRRHAVGQLMADTFELHDRSRFEVFAYSFGPDDGSALRQRLSGAFEHFLDVRDRSELELAEEIHARGIDIAIDLNGYTTLARPGILLPRPAPVQCHFLGFPGTLGAAHIDYQIVDPVTVPPDRDGDFVERLARLAFSYPLNDRSRVPPAKLPARSAVGLPDDAFVFCSFNNLHKLSPQMFDVWMRLLARVPDSVLWMMSDRSADHANLCREAQSRGIASHRLVFAPRVPLDHHLARMGCADLFLDSFPYCAHVTACDALWVGLPLLTCTGRTMQSRVGTSLLTALGLDALIAGSLEDFEQRAIALANDRPRLAGLRQRIVAARTSAPVFDTGRFARDLENAYQTMWECWCRGEPPASFSQSAAP